MEESYDLINTVVNIKDINLLKFMFPDFKVMFEPEMFPNANGIIFIGADKYLNYIKELGLPYIIVRRNAMYDLDNRETLLYIAYTKYGKKPPKYLLEIYKELSDEEFYDNFKLFWVTGVWMTKELNVSKTYFELTEAIVNKPQSVFKTVVKSMSEMDLGRLENSVLNFLIKAVNHQYNIETFYGRQQQYFIKNKSKNVERAVNRYLRKEIENDELRFINFALDLNNKISRSVNF